MASTSIYQRDGDSVLFNQLGVKVELDRIGKDEYYGWLDAVQPRLAQAVPGAQIAEKPGARQAPPLNTAIYYDTPDYRILPTGALLRTSCNHITHAFCAFKDVENDARVRQDFRHVFADEEKRAIQRDADSPEAVSVVYRLLARTDVEHPGTHLRRALGIDPTTLTPAIKLDDFRYTFFVWLDGADALRCSVDRYYVMDLRSQAAVRDVKPLVEVEMALYPRIAEETAADPRVSEIIDTLSADLCATFGVSTTKKIKYQRSAERLGLTASSAAVTG